MSEPVLIPHVREPNSFTLDAYLKHQGYEALRKALNIEGATDPIRTVRSAGYSLDAASVTTAA